MNILDYLFLLNSIFAGFILGIVMPIIGLILILRKSAFIADTTAHISLNGLILARILMLNSDFVVLIFSIIVSFIIEFIRQKRKTPSDSVLAILLAFGLALTLMLISIFRDLNFSVSALLFGNILTISVQNLVVLFIIAIIVIAIFIKYYKSIFLCTFNEEIAFSNGISTKKIGLIIAFLTAIVIGISLQYVGSVLISGLIVIPANAALQFKLNYKKSIIVAIIFGVLMNTIGIILSAVFNLPASASIIFTGLAILGVSYLLN